MEQSKAAENQLFNKILVDTNHVLYTFLAKFHHMQMSRRIMICDLVPIICSYLIIPDVQWTRILLRACCTEMFTKLVVTLCYSNINVFGLL